MLPLHRLAAQQQQSSSQSSGLGARLRAFTSSRLATRLFILLGACSVAIFFFSSPFQYSDYGPDFGPWSDAEHGHGKRPPPPPGHNPDSSFESPPIIDPNTAKWAERAGNVRDSFIHAWNGYDQFAFGYDELAPLSNRSVTNFNGWGVTIVDSLSTMQVMGLNDIYERAMQHVRKMSFENHKETIPFFETVIRYLGGLLSAYAFTNDPDLLRLSDELGTLLLPVFKTKSGLPMFGYNPSTGETRVGFSGASLFAEIASCQMEYKYLAHLTGKATYFKAVDRVIDIMEKEQFTGKGTGRNPGNGKNEGLWAIRWDTKSGKGLGESASVGALADSGYEYLLKGYLLSGRSEKRLLDMYLKSARGVLENMMYLSSSRNLLYVTDLSGPYGSAANRLEHLACFYGGLLALGVETLLPTGDMSLEDAELHRWAAEGLSTTCYLAYAETPSGLGPEEIHFGNTAEKKVRLWMDAVREWKEGGRQGDVPPGVLRGEAARPVREYNDEGARVVARGKLDYWHSNPVYYSRPETLESIYLMWKVTKDELWRERGWEIYQSIEKHMKTPAGYASAHGIVNETPQLAESMPSYFMAETLKYLYLLFTDKDPISFDKWQFNTEAHPLPIFQWTDKEKSAYGIRR